MSIAEDVVTFPIPRQCPMHAPEQYDRFREQDKPSKVRFWNGNEAWIFTRYKQVRAILGDNRFSVVPTAKGFPSLSPGRDAITHNDPIFLRLDRIDLATHIADVVNFTKWRDLREIVLCGHSYGGHVISGAAEHIRSRIASIVFLDAILPQQGDSVVGLSSRMEAAVRQAAENRKIAIPAVSAAAFQVNERDRGWVDGLLRHIRFEHLRTRLRLQENTSVSLARFMSGPCATRTICSTPRSIASGLTNPG
jgi:pimeloyl-ACP methyl ester carboxylesterase